MATVAACMVVAAGCTQPAQGPGDVPVVTLPAGFPPLPTPANNALSTARVQLGRTLFFDTRLSRTLDVSCASCHRPEYAFADPRRVSIGVEGRAGSRNSPSLANMAWNTSYFRDGGVPTLEQQAIAPILNPVEMDMKLGDVAARLNADPAMAAMFGNAYDTVAIPGTITKAIACYVRTLISGNSRYDHYIRGDTAALDQSEKRGMELFFGPQTNCTNCHEGFNFTNNRFANNSLYRKYADSGRARVTGDPADVGKFKVPSLRNAGLTAPYMHDGSVATLQDVMDHYNSGGKGHPNADPAMRPLNLTPGQRADLVAFLNALTDSTFGR